MPKLASADAKREPCLPWLFIPTDMPWIALYTATIGVKDYQLSICLNNSGKELSVFLDHVDAEATDRGRHIRAVSSYGIRKGVQQLASQPVLLRLLAEKQCWIWAENLLLSPMERLAAEASKAHRELRETQEQLSA